jgi:hypothetical protein
MAAKVFVCASSHEFQKPTLARQVGQMVVGKVGNTRLVIQLRMLREPRKERTMSLLVVSVATKPVTSVLMLFSNSVRVLVLAASTRGQLPWAQVSFVLGELLLFRQ